LKEIARGAGRHGSCGMGVGESMADWLAYGSDVLFAGDLDDRALLIKKLTFMRDAKLAQLADLLAAPPPGEAADREIQTLLDPRIIEASADVLHYFSGLVKIVDQQSLGDMLRGPGTTIFEGAQGVLLDEWYGFAPYNTWSTLSFKNADTLLAENNFDGETLKLGLMRAYATRHGAGPFVTEDPQLTELIPDRHNANNDWQRSFRVGYADLVAARYALAVSGKVDGLVITNLDRMAALPAQDAWQVCTSYRAPADASDVDEYFETRDGLVTRIKLPPDPTNLVKQERLTQLLFGMQPVYTPYPAGQTEYAQAISQALNIPLAISSHGPAAGDKLSFMLPGASFHPARRPDPAMPFAR
jgi:adenylosuccinate synthase